MFKIYSFMGWNKTETLEPEPEPVRSHQIKKIKLEGGRPWGFKIAGGAEVNKPIVITKIDPDGQGSKFGINEGDMIASVNGVSLRYYVTRKEAVQHIKRAGANIELEIQPNPQSSWNGQSRW